MEKEDLDISNAKKKLFAKAMDDKNMSENNEMQMMTPFNFDLKTTDKGEVESVGGSAKLGNTGFSIGGTYNPSFSTTMNPPPGAPPFIQPQEVEIPSSYNVGLKYTKGPFTFNYTHGTRGSSGGADFNMKF